MQLGKIHTHDDVPNHVYASSRARVPLSHESEKALETSLRKACEARGWMALKLLSQLHRGLPDRLILAEGGATFFAEIKTTGKKPTRLQTHCHECLRMLGFLVFVIDSSVSLAAALTTMDRAVADHKLSEP